MRRIDVSNYKNSYDNVWIDKELFNSEMIVSSNNGRFTEKSGELIVTLVDNITFSRYFKLQNLSYEAINGMRDYAIMYILENGLRLYTVNDNANAFAYFSSVIFSKMYFWLSLRYGKKRRLDMYGSKIKYRNGYGKWKIASIIPLDTEYYG